ncbi:Skt5p [Rhizophagus irregularis DAOM 197198w]|uniref:Skt5p n=1 Tax=Rhizophagus irregularis (strain DAOM 197198w) TaxID=1432141 RepID=A0A015I6Q7_RHIIW|nr:Skt5p [Rhizophagus irregularis DAOM 197198w]
MGEDRTKAFELFHNAENQDHDLTLYYLGQYGYGSRSFSVKNDKKLAIDYYEKAANNGNLAAKYNLGNCYLVGKLVNKDVKKGFELIQQTAEIEFSLNGITMLGFCYHNGIGTQEDKEAAFKLYKKAANLGDKVAQYNLAQMYEKEDNTMKDINNAIRWYKESGYKDSVKRAKKLLKIKVEDFLIVSTPN